MPHPVLPHTSCEQEVSNEGDDGVLDQDYQPDKVAGKVKIHDILTES